MNKNNFAIVYGLEDFVVVEDEKAFLI